MRYVIRTLLGFGLIAFSWVLFGYAIYQLLQVGTCASGGPYVVARECPSGIERVILMIPAGLLAMGIGAVLYGGRGTPPGSTREASTGLLVVWTWTGLFWSLAAGCLLGIYGPDANPGPGGELGGWIVAGMGIVMGAGGFLAVDLPGRGRRDPQKVRPAVTRVAQTASRFSAGAGAVDRLDTLDRLRKQGTLTDAEFETLKQRIMEGEVMATEGSLNPLPLVLHVVALAAGLYLGWIFMAWVSPDLPSDETEAGVSATAVQVAGDDPNSLLRAGPLAGALESLDEQLAAGEGIAVLRIEPGEINVEGSDAEGTFEPSDVDPAVAERIVERIGAQRPAVDGLDDIQYMELVATEDGPRWYVQLVSTNPRIDPPWTYGTDLDGLPPLDVGGAPPTPVAD